MRQFWLKRFEKYYQKNKWHLVADIAFLALIILLSITLILIRVWRPENVVSFETKVTSAKVTSGEMTEFVIDYHAQKEVKNNSVSFNWPKNFVLDSVEPAANFNLETNTLKLDDLPEGGNGEIKIRGRVWGAIGERQNLFYFFNCNLCPNGLVESLLYTVDDSVLSANWQLPEIIYQGVEFTAKVELENKGDVDLKNINLLSGDDFKILDQEENIALAAGEKREVALTLVSNSDQKNADLRLKYYLSIGGTDRLQGELAQLTDLTENKFQIVLAPRNKVVKNGEEVIYDLAYQNGNPQALDNLQFSFSGGLSNVRLISSEPSLTETKNAWKLKQTLNSNQDGKASFAVVFKDKNELEQKITLVALADYEMSGQALRYRVESMPVKFFSRLQIKSSAYYYSPQGDQLGIGPLPPQVGMATNYWIFWELSNNGNDLENFSLSATLPKGVIWSGKKTMSAGTFRYNDLSGIVSWDLGSVAKSANASEYHLGFEVSVFPESSNLGQLMILANNINYQATDTFVGQTMSGGLNNLSTNLDADLLGHGRGQVVDQQ